MDAGGFGRALLGRDGLVEALALRQRHALQAERVAEQRGGIVRGVHGCRCRLDGFIAAP